MDFSPVTKIARKVDPWLAKLRRARQKVRSVVKSTPPASSLRRPLHPADSLTTESTIPRPKKLRGFPGWKLRMREQISRHAHKKASYRRVLARKSLSTTGL